MKLHRLTAAVFSLVLSTFSIVTIYSAPATAHEGEEHTDEAVAQAAESSEQVTTQVTYDYIAQDGDSYSAMARKAVQTYGLKNNVNLSLAKIVYAETNLTQGAGMPLLNLGQQVSFQESQVKTWVENAGKLSPEQEAAWAYYVPYINFNTDTVGEAK